jgi:hypothetical protein
MWNKMLINRAFIRVSHTLFYVSVSLAFDFMVLKQPYIFNQYIYEQISTIHYKAHCKGQV